MRPQASLRGRPGAVRGKRFRERAECYKTEEETPIDMEEAGPNRPAFPLHQFVQRRMLYSEFNAMTPVRGIFINQRVMVVNGVRGAEGFKINGADRRFNMINLNRLG